MIVGNRPKESGEAGACFQKSTEPIRLVAMSEQWRGSLLSGDTMNAKLKRILMRKECK
jgi:hypothetical protein